MKNSVKMFKSAQKCTKFYKNSQKPSKTVPKFAVSRIWYFVSRRAGVKNKPNICLTAGNTENAEKRNMVYRKSKKYVSVASANSEVNEKTKLTYRRGEDCRVPAGLAMTVVSILSAFSANSAVNAKQSQFSNS